MDLTTNLAGYYPLEESSGSVLTQVGSINGTVYGTPTRQQPGKNNNCYQFTGNNAIYLGDNVYRFTTDFTVSLWFYATSIPSIGSSLFSRYFSSTGYRCYNMGITAAGAVYFNVYNTSNVLTQAISSTGIVSTNTWYHVVFVKSGTNMKIFLNNSLIASSTSAPVTIRNQAGSGSNLKTCIACASKVTTIPDAFFIGYLDEVAIWNIGLLDEGITTLWNNGSGKYYPFQPSFITIEVPNPTYPVFENGEWIYSTAQNNYELPYASYHTTGHPSTAVNPYSHWKFIDENDNFEFNWCNNVCFDINFPIIISYKETIYYPYEFTYYIRCWYDTPTGSPSVNIPITYWHDVSHFMLDPTANNWATISFNITDYLIANNVDFARIKKISFDTQSSVYHYRNSAPGNLFVYEPQNRYIVDISSTCYTS